MSLFLQYQLGQALHDVGQNDGGGADGAGAGFGFGLGFMMPWLLARAFPPHVWQAPPPQLAAPAGSPRFCGECGGGLLPNARYCGHCGLAVWRSAR